MMKHKLTAWLLALALCLGLAAPALARDGDFAIEDGVLTGYFGPGGDMVIPDGVTSIRLTSHGAHWTDVTSITIPASVTSISEGAFSFYCGKVTAIHVDEENPAYCDVDGVLFSRDMTLLHAYPAGKQDSAYTIPDSVTDVGASAFEYCGNLTDITVPETVTRIGYDAFWGTPWEKSLGDFPTVNGILMYYCGDGGDVVIPDGVTRIMDSAFYGYEGLISVTIPGSVTEIEEWAFYECNDLREVSIPAGITAIGPGAFSGCNGLTAIHVQPGNPNYSAVDGVLLSKDKTQLHTYPAGKPTGPYTIPDGVTRIEAWAFDDCVGLTDITIPNGVTAIGHDAFIGCNGLTEVTIPDSVTAIGEWAFSRCKQLSDVYYGGSEEQWKAIEIGQYNSGLTNATIHYNSVPEPTPSTPTGPSGSAPSTPVPVEVKRFSDVNDGDYFATAVEWAAGKHIAAGTTDTTFSPNAACTTAQILTFLWRAEGGPAPAVENPFSDVDGSDYYYEAALWAFEKELVSGPVFGGDTPCTRSQAVTCLWKLAGKPQADAVNFTDVSASADYAPAVAWAAQTGVTCGTSDTTFSPSEVCTRGQIVTFLYRDLK